MHAYLFTGLEAGPRTIRNLIGQVDPSHMDTPTHPGRFTPREVLAHLADWEPISRGRMQTAVATPGATVPDLDEEKRAEEQNYGSWDPLESAKQFAARREETLAWLKSLPAEDWGKIAVHSARGPMTVYDYANLEIAHDTYHVVQLCAVLEVGR